MKILLVCIIFIGLSSLLIIDIYRKPITIDNLEQLKEQNNNQKVSLIGKVLEQKNYDSGTLLVLENNISVWSEKKPEVSLKNQTVTIEGKVQSFRDEKEVLAEKIDIK